MDIALLRPHRPPVPRPLAAVVRGRAWQERLGRWTFLWALGFAVLCGMELLSAGLGWRAAQTLFARFEWLGGLCIAATLCCAAAWGLVESQYGTPGRAAALAQLCRLRSLSPEVEAYLREVAAQGRTVTTAEAYELLHHYAPLLRASAPAIRGRSAARSR